MREGGRRGGRARTVAKRRAARANGVLGGRPRKDAAAAAAAVLARFHQALAAGELEAFIARLEFRSWHSLRRLAAVLARRAAELEARTAGVEEAITGSAARGAP